MTKNYPEKSSGRYILNPLTYFSGFYLTQIIMLPLAYLALSPGIVDKEAYLLTFLISLFYWACMMVGFFLAPRFGSRAAHKFFAGITLRFSGNQLTLRERKILCSGLVCLFLVAFAVHMVVSGGGLLWITNSRQAYANYRIGVGPTYGLCLIFLYLSTLFGLFTISLSQPPPRIARQVVLRVCLFSIFAYFLGSKGYIISIAVMALAFYNYNVRPVRLSTLLLFGMSAIGGALALLFIQGTSSSTADVASYADYYHNSSEFLRRFQEFGGYRYGEVTFSDLWSYVPRAIFPNKPYEYGSMILDQLMFPGAAAGGYTPAFLPWTAVYLDFGLVGVAGLGLYAGIFLGWVHTFYAQRPPSMIRFIILIQLGFISMFPFVPTLGVLLVVLPLFCGAVRSCQTIFGWLKYATVHQALSLSGRLPH